MRTSTLRSTLRGTLLNAAICGLGGGAALAAGASASTDPEILLRQARTLKEYRDCRGAVRVISSLLQEFPRAPATRKATELLDDCLPELQWSDLEELAAHSPVRSLAARAMLEMAGSYASRDDCKGAIDIFDRIAARYPDTPEAWRASTRKAIGCLDRMGRHREAVETLRRVVEEAGHSPEAAIALFWLAQSHIVREERDEARAALTRLLRDYPPDFEYPSSPGLKIGKAARTDLRMLDQYLLGPPLDKITCQVRFALGLARFPMGGWRGYVFVIVVPTVVFGAQIAALVFVLFSLWVARFAQHSRPSAGSRIFVTNWSLAKASTLVLVLWAIDFLYQVTCLMLGELGGPGGHPLLFWVQGDRIIGLGIPGVALLACLWREPIRRIFAIGRRSLTWVAGGLALFIAYGLIGSLLRHVILWASGRSTEPVVPHMHFSTDFSNAGMAAVTVVTIVLAAAAEECIFRGVLYEAFERLSDRWVAAFLSSILFGAVHVEPLADLVTLTLMGLLLVYLREKSGSLFAPLALHVFNNMLAALAHTLHSAAIQP